MEIYQKLRFHDMVVDGDCRWLWDVNYEALYKWDIHSNEIKHVGTFSGKIEQQSYRKLLKYKNKLIILPHSSDEIMIYDKENGEFRYVEIEVPGLLSETYRWNKFKGGIICGNYAYLSGSSPYVLKFNLETEKIEAYVDIYESVPDGEDKMLGMQKAVLWEDTLYIPSGYYNVIFTIDLKTFFYNKINIPNIDGGFFAGVRAGSDIWLVLQEELAIIKWNPESKEIEKRAIYLKDFVRPECRKSGEIILWNDILWVFNLNPEQLIGMNLKTGKWKYHKSYNNYFKAMEIKNTQLKQLMMIKQVGEKVWCVVQPNFEVICIDLENDTIRTEYYAVSELELKEWEEEMNFKIRMKKNILLNERKKTLEDYLRILKVNDIRKWENIEMENIGDAIYKKIELELGLC